jgi:hypothetical protein
MVFVFLAQAIWKAAVLIQVSIEAIVCFLPGPIDRDSQEKKTWSAPPWRMFVLERANLARLAIACPALGSSLGR